MAYSSQKTVPSAVSACSKEVRDAQAKIREVLRTSDAIPDAEKALISNLLDGLTEAIDDQMVLSEENMNRIRKTEAAAVKDASSKGHNTNNNNDNNKRTPPQKEFENEIRTS
eukprot:GILI01021924.1.p1 GENE.GILI01021924.1~~GILI01021924.1.p1  ORF type:complete len:124 (+),score=32.42 GILI01021924.1:39-374(+)